MPLNTGLVTGSKSPFVTPLTRPTVTTRVLTNMGNGTFSVITVSQVGGVVTFGGGAMTSVNASVLAPNVVITPQHQVTPSKVIVFQ